MRNGFLTALALSSATVTLAIALASPAMAQETTSAIGGQVTNDQGASVSGAAVTVLHVPSGTKSVTTTDAGGNFALRGLRVGGPYTVTIQAAGLAKETIEGLSLTVGDTLALPVQLTASEIVVTATPSRNARQLITGSQSTFNSADIANIVSSRRDVRDIIRRDPLAGYNPNVGGVTIAGGNIRTQRFSVDGVQMQDSFGLNYGGLPSTRGIVSIEAIDQLTVKAAPYDISEGNFQGGAVNVVIKSGTNKLHGSVFGNFGDPGITGSIARDNRNALGDSPAGFAAGRSTNFPFKNYGGSLSGPIIKDKLFFLFAYEKLSEGAPNTFGVNGSSAANIVTSLSQAQVDDVITRYNAAGYDKYNIGNVPSALSENDEKYNAKLDWNITTGQRLSISYIHAKNVLPNFATGAATGSTSASTPYIQLQSNSYQLTEMNNAISGQLNSQWSDTLSSELRVAYRYYRRGQDPFFGPDYAQMNVCIDQAGPINPATGTPYFFSSANNFATTCTVGSPTIRLGPDTPRQANKFNSRQLTINANVQLRLGDHTVKMEYDRFRSRLYNLFVLGGGNVAAGLTPGGSGAYYFDSLEDFSARRANEFTLGTTTTGNKNDGFVDWAYTMNTIGLQDTWKVNPDLTINAGLRFDFYGADQTILENPNLINRLGSLYPGITNTGTLSGKKKLQPRVGFNWQATPNLRLMGGFGLFSGGISDVFVSNNYSNSGAAINSTGATISSIDILRTGGTAAAPTCTDRNNSNPATNVLSPALCAIALNNVGGGTVPQTVIDYLKSNASVSASSITNFMDPRFKLPAQWKYNLSVKWKPDFSDMGLGSGWALRADVLYSKAQQALRWTDLRAQPLVIGGVTQVAPDGRPRYGSFVNGVSPGGNYDMMLTNTTKGRSWVFSAAVNKESKYFDWSLAYTRQNVKDVTGVLTSSTVSSAYGSVPTSDPNSGGDYGRSAFEITNTFRAVLNFHKKFFGDNETRFGVNWELRSGQPYSVTMQDFRPASTAASGSNFNAACPVINGRSCIYGTATNTSSHLLYVPDFNQTPTNNGLTYGIVTFADAGVRDAVQALVQGTALAKYQGKIAPKNLLTGPVYSKVDINMSQEIKLTSRYKFTALFSIENFLNMLNRNWGTYQDFGTTSVVQVACQAPAAGAAQTCPGYTYSTYTSPRTSTYAKASLYTIRLGARFDF